ncbi:MAG: hypothetical protein WBZ05_04095 [Desulfobacterales bacterium]
MTDITSLTGGGYRSPRTSRGRAGRPGGPCRPGIPTAAATNKQKSS